MDLLSYQRTIFGFHGCDKQVADAVLTGGIKLSASENAYDWLGRGIYFWEHGPMRALEWAQQQAKRKGSCIKEPAVLGAVIQLGNCFDLLDVRFTRELARSASRIIDTADELGISLPRNQSASRRDYDWLKRHLDCFILNNSLPEIERTLQTSFDTVRGVFQEGEPAFKGAGLRLKSHIQIAVRNPTAIIGYFKPENL
jgi:hypothetical protein